MFSKIVRNDYSLNLINKIYSILLGLISSAFLIRYLGVILKGEYSYITEIVLVLTLVLNLGIHQSYSYFYRRNNGGVFEKYISIYLIQLIFHSLFSIVLIFFCRNNLYIYVAILIPFSVINQQMESTMAVENIRLKIKIHMFNVTLRMISFVIMFQFLESSLLPPVLLTIFLNTMSIIIYFHYSKYKLLKFEIDFVFLKEVLSYSWVPMFTALLITLNYSIDIFFLKHMGNAIELGLYSTAVGIVNYFWLIPDSFKEVLVSKVARDYSIESTLLAIKISVSFVILTIIAFLFIGEFALDFLYGSTFVEAYKVTLLLSLGAISMVFYKMIGVVLLSEGRRWVYFYSLLISVIINVIANIILIPIFGMYGAALASVMSYSVCGILFLLYFVKYKKLKTRDIFLFNSLEIMMFKNKIKRK